MTRETMLLAGCSGLQNNSKQEVAIEVYNEYEDNQTIEK